MPLPESGLSQFIHAISKILGNHLLFCVYDRTQDCYPFSNRFRQSYIDITKSIKLKLGWMHVRLVFRRYGHSLPTTDSSRAVVSYWRKDVHIILVN